MRAWRVHELGDPSKVMSLDEVEQPTPGEGQVLVKVRAAALNFPDVLMAMGMYQEKPPLPYTPGVELCGEIVETGQRIIGSPSGGPGAFAEYALMDANNAWPVPDSMTDEKAASLYLTYQTGYVGLHRRADIQAGDWLLVHAGAGGVGTAAIQLGKAAGATVIATAGGSRKTQVCKDLGADHVIDYTIEDFVPIVKEVTGGHGADIVYDPVGGDVFDKSTKCIAFEGRLVVVGFTSGRMPEAKANHLLVKNYSVVGLHWGLYRKYEPSIFGRVHDELVKLVESGAVDPLVGAVHPLAEAPEALMKLASRDTVGKVVLGPLTDARAHLRADCSRCAGLCCVAPAFAASADFAIDKPAGRPCPNLREDFRCGIHADLRERGFPGCEVFDCFGAGQQLTQVTFGGRSWRQEGAAQQFAVLPVMRQLHESLWYLTEALDLPVPALHDEVRTTLAYTERLTAGSADELLALDAGAHRRAVGELLGRVSGLVRGGGPDLRNADLMGRDLRRRDLRGAGLLGAYLIGADLRGVDLGTADLLGADLRATDVRGADLSRCLFLTRPQVTAARGDMSTRLPVALETPARWR